MKWMMRAALRALAVAALLLSGQFLPAQAGAAVEYVSPQPGSDYNPAGTTIAVRYGQQLSQADLSGQALNVSGSHSGRHTGQVVLADDQKTLIFKPDQPFTPGETVTVAADQQPVRATGEPFPPVDFSFGIVPTQTLTTTSTTGQIVLQASAPAAPDEAVPAGAKTYATAPADLPKIGVTVPATNTAPGYVFASNFQLSPGPSGYYLLIVDNNGEPVYYQRLDAGGRSLDFKVLPDGNLGYMDTASNTYVIEDNTYRQVNTVRPGNDYQWMDEHDVEELPNAQGASGSNHFLVLSDEARIMDLTAYGGKQQARVTSQVLQELDSNHNVVFQWRILDHTPITATTESLTSQEIDFSHANAVGLDSDGNILLSSRHLDEITKIDRQTGAIIWRLGGKQNQFSFGEAPGVTGPVNFYHQHDVRVLPNGDLTIFDNHNAHDPQLSRVLEYKLDQQVKTATLVRVYSANPAPYALAMGNGQYLPNGDTLIGWGTNLYPNLTEVRPDGTTNFALDFGGSNVTYRAFRFPWQGYPTWPPALVAQTVSNTLTLSMSWNGATEVAGYRIYGGNTVPPKQLLQELPKRGFETTVTLPGAAGGYCFYEVVPVDKNGHAMQASPVAQNWGAQNATSCFNQAVFMGLGD